ncbi:acyl carrier protein [Marinifilum fragile]|uniref:acyl carrier protein n=1 Tax=Marinifilum fragile TaxID=570161 RepID=UPI002AA5E4AE|nr:acyl carrier protein [Marinifilum fragile]
MKNQIKEIIKNTFKLNSVNDNISQANCSKWDSLNHLNLTYELETHFDISLEPDEILKMKNLEDIVVIMEQKLN